MKNILKRVICWGLAAWVALPALQAKGLSPQFQLLPQPQRVEVMAGNGFRGSELTYLVADEGVQVPVLGAIADALPRCLTSISSSAHITPNASIAGN